MANVPGSKPTSKRPPPATPAATKSVEPARGEEPVWLVRIVVLLFFVGFAAFLAREIHNFVRALG